jgi:hypothetical protein
VNDGKGPDNVAVMTYPMGGKGSVLSMRDGRTGRLLWRRAVGYGFGFDTARLGPSRKPALVVYETSFTGASDPVGVQDTGEQSTTIVALDAASGAVIWSSAPVVGTYAASVVGFTEANALYPMGVLHDRGGDRLLALDVSQSFSIAAAGSQAEAVVYDGVTGAESTVGGAAAGDDFTYAVPTGDLNGDGLADWYTSVGGDVGSIAATSGANGEPLWEHPIAAAGWLDVMPVADLDGDHHADVVVTGEGPNAASGVVTAYNGSKGTVVFARPGDVAFSLGRVRGSQAIAIWNLSSFSDMKVTAIAGNGKQLWASTIAFPSLEGGGSISIDFGPAGDVDGDHVADLFASMAFASTTRAGTNTTVMAGRTGHQTTGRAIGDAVYGSFDGHGCDFLSMTTVRNRWKATAYDGLSRRKLWTVTQPVAGRSFLLSLGTANLGLGRGPALVVSLWTGARTHVFAVHGRSGRTAWNIAV